MPETQEHKIDARSQRAIYFQKKGVHHAEQFLSQHLLTGLRVNASLYSCYSNRSTRRICWHLDGLYFSDIWRGEWRQSLTRGLSDIKWLPFQLDHIWGCFERGLLSAWEWWAALWRGGGEEGERERTLEGRGEGWRNSWNVVGHAGLLFSAICVLRFWEWSQRNVTCIVPPRAGARPPALPQTPGPPIQGQGRNSLANKRFEHLALWILNKILQINYEND